MAQKDRQPWPHEIQAQLACQSPRDLNRSEQLESLVLAQVRRMQSFDGNCFIWGWFFDNHSVALNHHSLAYLGSLDKDLQLCHILFHFWFQLLAGLPKLAPKRLDSNESGLQVLELVPTRIPIVLMCQHLLLLKTYHNRRQALFNCQMFHSDHLSVHLYQDLHHQKILLEVYQINRNSCIGHESALDIWVPWFCTIDR